MLRRDLIIAVLVTFCLTTAPFMTIPTSSSPTVGEYDPWLDYNDDGRIDILDVVSTCARYGTTGDPTKNVSVTNWPSTQNVSVKYEAYSKGEVYNPPPLIPIYLRDLVIQGDTLGFKKVTIYVAAGVNLNFWVEFVIGGRRYTIDSFYGQGPFVKTYDVIGEKILLTTDYQATQTYYIEAGIYVTA